MKTNMKNIFFLILLMYSFTVVACEEETQGIVGATTDGLNSGNTKPGLLSSPDMASINDCVELPVIFAVVGYVYMPSIGTGGLAGILYALSAPTGGSGTVVITNTNVPSDMGCDGDYTEAQRLAVANAGYQELLEQMEWYIENEENNSNITEWDVLMAEAWVLVNTWTGYTYDFKFPDGTIGEYEVGPNETLVEETACPQVGGGS